MIMSEQRNRDLKLIYAISFVDLFAVGLVFPLFSTHLRNLGISYFTIGVISSLYSGLQVLTGPLIGSWSDIRDRKTVVTLTLTVCSCGYAMLGLTNSLFIIILARIILGVMKHTQTICKAMIADLLPTEERAGAFGRSAAFGSIGFIAGPLLGGHISELTDGFSYACFITSVLCVVNAILTRFLRNNYATTQKRRRTVQHSFRQQIVLEFTNTITDFIDMNWHALWDSFLLRFLFGMSVTMYYSQQSLYLSEHFELSQRHVGYVISFSSTIGTLSAFLLYYINDLFYKNDRDCYQRLLHFFTLMSITLICLYLTPTIELFLLFSIPFAISSAILRIVSMELMLKKSENTHRGSLSGSSNSIMSIARFVIPLTSGVISDLFGTGATLIFAALPSLAGLILCYFMRKSKQRLD